MTLPKNPEGALRTRKLDNKKHVHVYHFDQIDETQTTYVQLVATGVDKEEEDEVHLQAALTTQSDIPVPNASKPSLTYDSCYKPTFIQPINLIKFQDVFDHVIGVQYNIDQSDSVWLKNVDINVLDFEELMASMELLANESITVDCFDLAGFKSFLEVSDFNKGYSTKTALSRSSFPSSLSILEKETLQEWNLKTYNPNLEIRRNDRR